MKQRKPIKILAFVVTGYMLVALIWWAILLQKQNNQLNAAYLQNSELAEAVGYNFDSTKTMILGEGIVFGLALVLGMWIIYRSYAAEVKTAKNKSNFLLSVTHELRSPLTGISLNLETLKKTSSLSGVADQSLFYAQEETERLKILVENLLNSKANIANAPNQPLQNEKINLEELVHQVNSHHYPKADIQITEIGSNVVLNSERESLITIYRNLIDNAIKYSPNNSAIKVNIQCDSNAVGLSVTDQAPQIPKSEYQSIFNAFHRLEDEQVRASKGIGLGLYLAKQAADRIGGQINVNSNTQDNLRARGNTFTLSIPLS
jgi:K+-sensing histidine kinase KdpD